MMHILEFEELSISMCFDNMDYYDFNRIQAINNDRSITICCLQVPYSHFHN